MQSKELFSSNTSVTVCANGHSIWDTDSHGFYGSTRSSFAATKKFTTETRRRPGFLGAHASSVQQQSNGHQMHARGVRSQENSGRISFQAAKNSHLSSTEQGMY